MNDADILAIGRSFIELTFQREQLIQENRALDAKLKELTERLKAKAPVEV